MLGFNDLLTDYEFRVTYRATLLGTEIVIVADEHPLGRVPFEAEDLERRAADVIAGDLRHRTSEHLGKK